MKVIVLDFDGVVVESNNIKHEAFSKIFSRYPGHYKELMEYHRSHNHVCRADKFRHIFTNILNVEHNESDINDMVGEFTRFTRESIVNCPFVAGAPEFLKKFSSRYPLYLASATPLNELEIILKARSIYGYFKHVFGGPQKKIEMLSDIIRREDSSPSDVVFIGDSAEDLEVAKSSGVGFIARISDHKFEGSDVPKFKDLSGVSDYIEKELN